MTDKEEQYDINLTPWLVISKIWNTIVDWKFNSEEELSKRLKSNIDWVKMFKKWGDKLLPW